ARVLVLTLAPPPNEALSGASRPDKIEATSAAVTPPPFPPPPFPPPPFPPPPFPPPSQPPLSQPPSTDEPTAERRHPLRFVWQMDADGRFVVGSDEFIELVGPRTMAAFGRLWQESATALNLMFRSKLEVGRDLLPQPAERRHRSRSDELNEFIRSDNEAAIGIHLPYETQRVATFHC